MLIQLTMEFLMTMITISMLLIQMTQIIYKALNQITWILTTKIRMTILTTKAGLIILGWLFPWAVRTITDNILLIDQIHDLKWRKTSSSFATDRYIFHIHNGNTFPYRPYFCHELANFEFHILRFEFPKKITSTVAHDIHSLNPNFLWIISISRALIFRTNWARKLIRQMRRARIKWFV